MTEDDIEKHIISDSSGSWLNISFYKYLPENFIRKYKDKVYWTFISAHQKLSEELIREFQDKVDWSRISRNQVLSENFIIEFENNVDWHNIALFQKLSLKFIKDNIEKFNIYVLLQNKNISKEIIQEVKMYMEIL